MVKQLQIAEEVENSRGIPGLVGFIDGTHIRLTHAPNGDNDYYNRKGYPSMQLQVTHFLYPFTTDVLFFYNYNYMLTIMYLQIVYDNQYIIIYYIIFKLIKCLSHIKEFITG